MSREFDEYQKAAINVEKNAVVSAGAGSGKTTVLSERFLHLIQKPDGCNVDEILTLTFTKKATVEMSDRIYKVLKEKAPEQAANFYKANIKTLDSYCNSVAKLGAHLYGITPDFTQDDISIQNQAYEKALPFILEHRDNLAIKEMVSTKDYAQIAQELFVDPILYQSTIAEPIDFENCFDLQVSEVARAWEENVKIADNHIQNLVAAYNEFDGKRDGKFLQNLKQFIEDEELPGPVPLSTNQIYASDSNQIEEYTKIIYSIAHLNPYTTKGVDAIKEVLYSLRPTADVLVSICNYVSGYYITKELIPLLKEFQDIINNIKRTRGILTFKDTSSMALCILRDYPEIRLLEKQKYRYIMIDEFQDNNKMQRDLLFLLAEKVDRMSPGVPEVDELCTEKLFFVGDEKQSIYMFRGAEVEVFRNLSKDFANGNLEMTTNYRSNQALIAGFNTIFGGSDYPPEEITGRQNQEHRPSVFYTQADENRLQNEGVTIPDYEAIYKTVTLSKTALEEAKNTENIQQIYTPKIHIARYDDEQEALPTDFSNEDAEAEWVALKIKELMKNGKKPSDMAVLMRSYTLQPLYERTFLRHGIPYNTEVVTGFYADGPINDLMAFLKICAYPKDSISYAKVLRSPFVNLSITDTMSILSTQKLPFEAGTEELLNGKSKKIYCELQNFYNDFSKSAKYEPLTSSISKLWYEAGYRYETQWNHTVELYGKLYDLLFELARQADVENTGLCGFVDAIDQYKEEKARLENMDIPLEQTSGVHILTIYKSKGLEYDTVFIIGSEKGTAKDSNSTPVFYSKDFGATINTPACKSFPGSKSQYFYDLIKEKNAIKHSAELRRIVYVALTRAKNELYITNGKYKLEKDPEKYLPGGTSKPDTIYKILAPIIDFYSAVDENNKPIYESPFTVENIPPLKRAQIVSDEPVRKNSVEDKKVFVENLENGNPYTTAEENGNIISKETVAKKYITPSKLHTVDDETSSNISNRYEPVSGCAYPEISEIVRDSIPQEEWNLNKENPSYEPKPRFDYTNFGTIAHAYMEAQMNHTNPVISNKEWVGLDNNQEKIGKIQQICTEMAEKFKKSAIGQAAIGSTEYYAEYEFRSKVGNKIVKGIIDLVFKNPDGTYTILDYKTNQTEEPEIYYNQLACYRQAISQMLGIKDANSIKCYLFYLRSGHEVDISEKCSSVDLEKAVNEIN